MTDLVLGSAQFGGAYGATNTRGRLDDAEVAAILRHAAGHGVVRVDTSPAYGDAQRRLAALAPAGMRYLTKAVLPTVDAAAAARELGVERLDALLLHRVEDLRDPRITAAWDAMRAARDDGRVGRIGASIYDAADLEAAIAALPGLDILQLPASIVDRRLLDLPALARLHDDGVELHARSAYLQGQLLADPDALPAHLGALRPVLAELRATAADAGVDVAALALGALREHPLVDAVVVGVTSVDELEQTLGAWAAAPVEVPAVPSLPDDVLDPRRWPVTP